METNVIYNEECLQGMEERIPDDSIDMILADLPYGTTNCTWDIVIPFDCLWEQYERITKENAAIVLTASGKFTPKLKMSNFELFRYEWIWKKNYSSGHLNAKKRPMRNHANILVFYKKLPTYNPQFENYADSVWEKFNDGDQVKPGNDDTNQVYGDFTQQPVVLSKSKGKYPSTIQEIKEVPRCNSERCHPTQKPVDLFKYLIKTYTNKGDIILDNVIGSGTTAVVAKALDRKYIGFEQDEKYYKIAQERTSEVQKELITQQ